MNGVHDMGGMHGMGPIEREENEPVFHHEWERRAFAMTVAAGFLRTWNIDMSRSAREQMEPAHYLATSYYEHWLFGLEKLLLEQGLVTNEEMAAGRAAPGRTGVGSPRALSVEEVPKALGNRRAARLDDAVAPRFKVGDRVVARTINPLGHTRLPRYARGREGVIDRDHGVFIFPDAHAANWDKKPQHVYSVRFAARELWGSGASPRDHVYVDMWDDYLDPA